MPSEYFIFGHVSDKTDSFAFGIVLIELLTGLPGMDARELVETADDVAPALARHANAAALGWPAPLLRTLARTVRRCTQAKPTARASVAAEMGGMERALAASVSNIG